MNPYGRLTEEQLLAEIAQYEAAAKEFALGGDIAVIAGEGRRVEYTRRDGKAVNNALRELYAEAADRGLDGFTGGGRAIPVRFS